MDSERLVCTTDSTPIFNSHLEESHGYLLDAYTQASLAQDLYERHSNRGERSEKLRTLLSLITQAQELSSELQMESE